MNKLKLKELLHAFFIEDIGERDLTSNALFQGNEKGKFTFLAKQSGIFCGEEVIRTGFHVINDQIKVMLFVQDGERIEVGQKLAEIHGEISSLLMGERVILNLIQRMSGIATEANKAYQILKESSTKACDTRKTTPGLRMLEKYAVRCGGVSNHRYGLYDGVMIKDNHIDFMGGITKAITKAKEEVGHMVKIEVETSTKEEVLEAVAAGADVIMFDNCTPQQIQEYVKLVPANIVTEASGGITLETLHLYRNTGVNYISLGCLTHSAKALDISAKVNFLEKKENIHEYA
ncbi:MULTISPECIES: carboxylating nicotinate-nucleotide diphosphorylase [Bacillus]|uniref:carboxylating nicotinate-nucleotide diphosphorylase n=1 Tax=Bacillus TaxID=1386 RepID=UPI0002F95278|nr:MULTISPECIES: carboxylating nicotinate-nucleotide diphosphorylase [Bacillus]